MKNRFGFNDILTLLASMSLQPWAQARPEANGRAPLPYPVVTDPREQAALVQRRQNKNKQAGRRKWAKNQRAAVPSRGARPIGKHGARQHSSIIPRN